MAVLFVDCKQKLLEMSENETTKNLTPEPKQVKIPKWIRKLQQESWQAELIISGVAIFSAVQLPGFIEKAIEWSIYFFDPTHYFILYGIFIYFIIGAYAFIFFFITHFVLRTFWIGMLGFQSVYPDGINEEATLYSKSFITDMKNDLPSGQDIINSLEKTCSTIFASTGSIILIFSSIGFHIIVILILRIILFKFFDHTLVDYFLICLGAIMFLGSIFSSLFHMKSLREKDWVKKNHYKWHKRINKMFSGLFYNPVSYITMTTQSHQGGKKSVVSFLYFFLLMIVCMALFITDSRILLLIERTALYENYSYDYKIHAEAYEGFYEMQDRRIINSVIENEHINGAFLKVFTPILYGEDNYHDAFCGEFEKDESNNKVDRRSQRHQFELDCYHQTHRFYVNDSLYQPELFRHHHVNKNEFGVVCHLPTKAFVRGKNMLRIEKLQGPDDVFRVMRIPFWFD